MFIYSDILSTIYIWLYYTSVCLGDYHCPSEWALSFHTVQDKTILPPTLSASWANRSSCKVSTSVGLFPYMAKPATGRALVSDMDPYVKRQAIEF